MCARLGQRVRVLPLVVERVQPQGLLRAVEWRQVRVLSPPVLLVEAPVPGAVAWVRLRVVAAGWV